MLADFANDVGGPVLLSFVAVGAAALALSIEAAFGVLDRRRWPFPPFALVLLAGAGWVVLYATGPDSRFEPDGLTRWGWAARSGLEPVVAAAVAIALAATVALLRAARSGGAVRQRRLAMPATALASAGLLVATLALTVGH